MVSRLGDGLLHTSVLFDLASEEGHTSHSSDEDCPAARRAAAPSPRAGKALAAARGNTRRVVLLSDTDYRTSSAPKSSASAGNRAELGPTSTELRLTCCWYRADVCAAVSS